MKYYLDKNIDDIINLVNPNLTENDMAMSVEIYMEDLKNGKCKYTVIARHSTEERQWAIRPFHH